MTDTTELLAPAGSFDSLKAAVFAGADAVYVGGAQFGARAYADNFDEENLKRAIEFTHIHGKKIYLTLNTLLKEDEINSQLAKFLASPYREGLDAVIVQDLGVLSFVHENFPLLKIHVSTQMGITTVYGVEALRRMGAERIILPRELSLEEIRRISRETEAELEMFIHGAMCYSCSGQCLMSSVIGGRSGNRGRCAGPCRLPWNLRGEDGRSLNRPEEKYLLNMKDLCTIRSVPQYLEAGVSSLKIEGRMKSPEYVAGTVEIYRGYLDRYLEYGSRKEEENRPPESGKACKKEWKVSPADLQKLTDLYSRGTFTDGYLYQKNGRGMLALDGPAERIRETEYISKLRNKYLETEKKEKVNGIVRILKHKEATFRLQYAGTEACVSGPVPEEAQSRPLTREAVKDRFSKLGNTCFEMAHLERSLDDDLFLDIKAMNGMRRNCVEKLTEKILAAKRREWQVSEEDSGEIYSQEMSAGNESVEEKTRVEMSAGGKNSGKNCDRKELLQERCSAEMSLKRNFREVSPVYTALISTVDQWEPVLVSPKISDIYVEDFLLEAEQIPELAGQAAEHGKRLYLALPHIFRIRENDPAEGRMRRKLEILGRTDGIGYLVRNPDECEFFLRYAPKPVVFDYTCWRMNHRAQKVWERMGAEYAVRTGVSPELNEKELLRSDVAGCEFIIYGRIPVMVTANCLRKTTVGCTGPETGKKAPPSRKEQAGGFALIDRKNTAFPVKTVCRYCYNLIYNSVPLSLGVEEDRLGRFRFGAYRYQFTTETARETADILAGNPVEKRTRGHFYRGVE